MSDARRTAERWTGLGTSRSGARWRDTFDTAAGRCLSQSQSLSLSQKRMRDEQRRVEKGTLAARRFEAGVAYGTQGQADMMDDDGRVSSGSQGGYPLLRAERSTVGPRVGPRQVRPRFPNARIENQSAASYYPQSLTLRTDKRLLIDSVLTMTFASASTSASTSHPSRGSMDESYLLWLLSDSNLPTGGFVASSGLESYVSHGFLHLPPADGVSPCSFSSSSLGSTPQVKSKSKEEQMAEATLRFLQDSLGSYARSALPFLREAHRVTCRYLDTESSSHNDDKEADAAGTRLEGCLLQLAHLEQTYHSLSLNHVLRRASRAQGIALLTLYARSFSSVPVSSSCAPPYLRKGESVEAADKRKEARAKRAAGLIDALKRRVRLASVKGGAPYGHLPTCWAVFTACLGVGLREYPGQGRGTPDELDH